LLFQSCVETAKTTVDPDKKAMQDRQISKLSDALSSVEKAVSLAAKVSFEGLQQELLLAAKDLLSDWLDRRSGASVKDNAIFSKLPKYWEEKFHQDMEALNVSQHLPVVVVRENRHTLPTTFP
jgi:cysteinyl-tRNA synthetase